MRMIINDNNELVMKECETFWEKALKLREPILVYVERGDIWSIIDANLKLNFVEIEVKGYWDTLEELERSFKRFRVREEPLVVFSNAVFLMPKFHWNKKLDGFPIFFATIENDEIIIKNVQELTDRELREGYDIERIYRNGGLEWDY